MQLPDFISHGKHVLSDLTSQGSQIADGFTNLFLENLDLLSPDAQAVYAARYSICLSCPMRVGSVCSKHQRHKRVDADCYVRGCTCHLPAATKSPMKHCVMHKWPPVDANTLQPLPYPADTRKNPCTP